MTKQVSKKTDSFVTTLQSYKDLIDRDIKSYAQTVSDMSLKNYGPYSQKIIESYLNILHHGGKRIRGILTMIGYEMCGGKDKNMILKASRAIEMIQAYILIVDDFQDNSDTRRGIDSAHVFLKSYFNDLKLKGDANHFGQSQAVMGALIGNHVAQTLLANLEVEPRLALSAINIVNRGMMITGHGQINDIINPYLASVSEKEINNVMEWKTAHYTFLNPLHFGMILAGADCNSTDAITGYAMNLGIAYQIANDINGIFGDKQNTGKNSLEDIREGKKTILVNYALSHADKKDADFLKKMLGNAKITQQQFKRVQQILIDSNALFFTKDLLAQYIDRAIASLGKSAHLWPKKHSEFLTDLAVYIRNSVHPNS